ncbi:MAG: SDR family oxidoreductase [Thermoanaerobaculales bacterium]|jgi:NAD(P)-dependent dehydrogenase (short-subunit alcohol dehydrogenase family)|nr:SDR family oxidoreductase [Thermoanaerobaculales bacterium]
MLEVRNRRVIVTGASSGIGLDSAQRLHEAGAEVCLVARRGEIIAAAAEKLGDRAWAHACDVSDESQVAALAESARERWGAVDGLVNNAGIAPMATLDGTDLETWERTFAINVRGPYLLCRALSPMLKEGVSPSVVNISSSLAQRAIPGMAAYNASKAALNHLTRALALEWAPAVRVNAIMPAVVDTPIHDDRGMSREDVEGMGAIHPMQRIGQPREISSMIRYLLSDEAAWMTGAVIPVDGGMTAA